MANTKVEDEYSHLPSPNTRYQRRLMRDRKACGKCVRCPNWDLKDGILLTKVRTDGTVYQKRLIYCPQHQAYVSERNRVNRDKQRGIV